MVVSSFHSHGATPKSMVDFMENPTQMDELRGTPILGNLQTGSFAERRTHPGIALRGPSRASSPRGSRSGPQPLLSWNIRNRETVEQNANHSQFSRDSIFKFISQEDFGALVWRVLFAQSI